MRKLTCQPGTDVSGASMLSMVQSLQSHEVAPLARQYGFETIDPDGWYPLQDYLDFMTELVRHPNLSANLVAMGMSIADFGHMPAELARATFPEMIAGWNNHYQANFRNGDVGYKSAVKVNDRHYKVIHEGTVIPDDLEYGVLYGFAKHFLPAGTQFDVWYDEEEPTMDDGGDRTIIHVAWE